MKVRINNNQPTSAQKRALRQECVKEFNKLLDHYNHNVAMQVLHILRFDFGFGQQRLQRFADKLTEMQRNQIERYEIEDEEIPDICEIKLKESGINTSAFLKEG